MRINTKVILLFIVIFLVSLAGLVYIEQHQRTDLKTIEKARSVEFENSFNEIIALKSNRYQSYVYDNTYWDDMVTFVQTLDKEWAEVNIVEPMDAQNYDYVAIFDQNSNMIFYHQRIESLNSIIESVPLSILDYKTPPYFQTFF